MFVQDTFRYLQQNFRYAVQSRPNSFIWLSGPDLLSSKGPLRVLMVKINRHQLNAMGPDESDIETGMQVGDSSRSR
jgi:hypothetical protein